MRKDIHLLENKLVPVYQTSTGEQVVYGTELHTVLEVKTAYKDWSVRRFNECDATENKDFEVLLKNEHNPKGGKPSLEHIIQLDTAKEMAMLERNEKGKQVRRYFIQVEKKYKEQEIKRTTISLKEQLEAAAFVAENLHIPQSNKIMMFAKSVRITTSTVIFFLLTLKMKIEKQSQLQSCYRNSSVG